METVKGNIETRWAKDVDSENALPEYPRPNMVRSNWKNLNGLWKYALTSIGNKPKKYQGNILVPYPIESSLSGVHQMVNESEELWYKRSFVIPKEWEGKNILLHFEAVDWKTTVWVNGEKLGEHNGGYDPFSYDITYALKGEQDQEIIISVWDPTDKGSQPCGKQVQNPEGIFYTPVSGIWQTVWLEPVSEIYIEDYVAIPDVDNKNVNVQVNVQKANPDTKVKLIIKDNGEVINTYFGNLEEIISLSITKPVFWTPEKPYLYDLEIELFNNSQVQDKIRGYFGMRKISLHKDDAGRLKIFLNNEFVFQNGPLDQGYWPDGIYTAPTDEALRYDIEIAKELGFNMLRKHVKIESRRFYYWCDKLGILVWQDMPTGGEKIGSNDPDIVRTPESAKQFEYELEKMIKTHINHPSIIMWVPFNEGWGQYDTERIVKLVKNLDPSRLVNNASGWTDRGFGDVFDIHHYPNPLAPEPQPNRAIVIGEFGGTGLTISDHMWTNENWGYSAYSNTEDLIRKYEEFYTKIWELSESTALSAVVYTQITDVETEANGLMTYDREIIKVDKEVCRNINTNSYFPAPEIMPSGGLFCEGEKIQIFHDQPAIVRYTINGDEPTVQDNTYNNEIILSSDVTIKAKAYGKEGESRTVTAIFEKTELKRPVYKTKYNERYTAGGDFALIDGKKGTLNFSDGSWQGFEGEDLYITIELKRPEKLDKIEVNFLEDTINRIFIPSNVEFLISEHGNNFTSVKKTKNDPPLNNKTPQIKTISVNLGNVKISHLRVIASNSGVCPDWNLAKGEKSWVFVDEITINK